MIGQVFPGHPELTDETRVLLESSLVFLAFKVARRSWIMTTRKFSIDGMHCESCVGKVKEALSSVPGISDVEVSLSPPEAGFNAATDVAVPVIQEALSGAGEYRLVESPAEDTSEVMRPETSRLKTYRPLLLLVAYLASASLLLQIRREGFEFSRLMSDFMGAFFIAFSFFKLLDQAGFARAFRSYDLVAKAWPQYAKVYPFLELGLGVAYLIGFFPFLTNLVTLVIMGVGALGVQVSLLKKQKIQCACLGSVFDLPMSTVTLVEDLAMAGMALLMLLM